MFHHFEEREFWPLKELNFHCRQPEVGCRVVSQQSNAWRRTVLMRNCSVLVRAQSFLKEVLKEICVYHRKGPNKSCYELKAQYKDSVSTKG